MIRIDNTVVRTRCIRGGEPQPPGQTRTPTRPHQIVRLQNDLHCVGWGVKLYSLTHTLIR